MTWSREDLLKLLNRKPDARCWDAIVEGIDELSDEEPEGFGAIIEALEVGLSGWPSELRRAPEHWWEIVQEGASPWGWELVKALRVGPGEETEQDDEVAHLTHLDLSGAATVSGGLPYWPEALAGFRGLESLDISGLGYQDLDILEGQASLRALTAYRCHDLEDITALTTLGVESLTLSPLIEEHIDAIGRATTLRRVDIDSGEGLKSLEQWAKLTGMVKLRLKGLRDLTSLEGISGWRDLEALHLVDASALKDISPLADLPRLRVVWLRGCTSLYELDALGRLPALEVLDLRGGSDQRDERALDGLKGVTIKR